MFERKHWLQVFVILALVFSVFALLPTPSRADAPNYLVDNNGDDDTSGTGPFCRNETPDDCSLRQAIELAENDGVGSKITFDPNVFDSNGMGIIITLDDPGIPLPALTEGNTTIDALADLFVPNPIIAIDGNGSFDNGFEITSPGNTIRGLSIYGFACGVGTNGGSILISGPNATNNTIDNNSIGVDLTGMVPSGPSQSCSGVIIRSGASRNVVQNRNIISGNKFNGVLISNASNNTVRGNVIGLQLNTAQDPLPNGLFGIQVTSDPGQMSTGNTIGGASVLNRNVISGNGNAGILVNGSGTMTTTIQGNFVGTNTSGLQARPNNGDGIRVASGAKGTTIAGSRTNNAPMVVSGNVGYGIRLTGAGTSNNEIRNTFVGVNSTANAALPNGTGSTPTKPFAGISIDNGASNNRLDGDAANYNLIAGNIGSGIRVDGVKTFNNIVSGSYIGIAPNLAVANGTRPIPNTLDGVTISNRANATCITDRNVIAGHTNGYGIRVTNGVFTTLDGNVIGLSLDRTTAVPNALGGIYVQNSSDTLIGGPLDIDPNIVSGNGGPAGIVISGTNNISTTIAGNLIGLSNNAAGKPLAAQGNAGDGILVTNGAQQTIIGGTMPNTIVGHTAGTGIALIGSDTLTATVLLNRIGYTVDAGRRAADVALPNLLGITANAVGATEIITNQVAFNTVGISLTDMLTATVRGNTVRSNSSDGVVVNGASRNIAISENNLLSNGGLGVLVAGTAQRVAILDNRMSQNDGGGISNGIRLAGTTVGSPGDPANPNHDIDPPVTVSTTNLNAPLRVRLNNVGLLTSFVLTSTNKLEGALSPPSACVTCTIQFFKPDPELATPDGQGFTKIISDVVVVAENGQFTAQLPTPLPPQVLLTATDGFGNTSEFGLLAATFDLALTPVNPVSEMQNAAPGDTITYTYRLENLGTIDLTDIDVGSQSATNPDWTTVLAPVTDDQPLSLASGASTLITVTLTLPLGSNPSEEIRQTIAAGYQDVTELIVRSGDTTATRAMTTTVLPQAVITVTPPSRQGSGQPGNTVPYAHTITNNGNITATINLAANTDLASTNGQIWTTTVNPTTLQLGPGESADAVVNVTIPEGAQTIVNGQPVTAVTNLSLEVIEDTRQNKVVTDTTRVTLDPRAIMFRDRTASAAAGETIRLRHTVENTSNGPATFKLNAGSSQGSTVRFESDTPGVTLNPDNTFTISNRLTGDETNVFNFVAVITLNDRLLPGDVDSVTLFLTETDDSVIGGASVEDRITITRGGVFPRLWLPIVYK